MKRVFSFLSVFFLCTALFAQTDSLRLGYVVKGLVTDAETGKPLESVHVSVPGRHHATVTNADGEFVIKSDREINLLECSYLGYHKRRVSAAPYVTVKLRREALPVPQATIVSGDPLEILNTALDRVEECYCPRPELLECFYRETVQKRSRYTYVAEAVARLYKDRNNGNILGDAAALEKSRLLVSQKKRDTLSVKTQGGPNLAITCDALKNKDLIFSEEDMLHYRLKMESPAFIGDRLQIVIRMIPDGYSEWAMYESVVYIDAEWLSFTRIEASLDMRDRPKAIRAILVSKPFSLRFFPKEASIVLNYRPIGDGKVRLEYFRSTIRFDCDWRKRLFKTHYTAINELVVTDVYPDAVSIPRRERFRTKDYMSDKAMEFQDPEFWADYNIIEPSESLEHAIGRLRK